MVNSYFDVFENQRFQLDFFLLVLFKWLTIIWLLEMVLVVVLVVLFLLKMIFDGNKSLN